MEELRGYFEDTNKIEKYGSHCEGLFKIGEDKKDSKEEEESHLVFLFFALECCNWNKITAYEMCGKFEQNEEKWKILWTISFQIWKDKYDYKEKDNRQKHRRKSPCFSFLLCCNSHKVTVEQLYVYPKSANRVQ